MLTIDLADALAAGGVFGPGLLALMFVLVWRGQREVWAVFFAAAYLVVAVLHGSRLIVRPVMVQPTAVSAVGALVVMLLLTWGLVRYVDVPRAALRKNVLAALAVAMFVAVFLFSGVAAERSRFGPLPGLLASALAGFLACQALTVWWAMRREPAYGHGLIFAALMLYLPVFLAAAFGLFELHLMRYAVLVPLTVSGATILTTGLLRAQYRAAAELQRRRRAEAELQSLNDTLEQRVARRTAELNEMVGGLESFNRSVSHDLRGPLGGIAGVSRLANEALARQDTPAVQRMLAVISAEADALGHLVNDMLALARVSDTELVPQSIDLPAFVHETLAQMRLGVTGTAALLAGVEVVVAELPAVEADPGLLRQVYVNLVGNAVKFSRDAQPARVEVGAFERDGEQVFYVRDNGVGFDSDQAERLFQPFRRLHGQRYEGHGVGLSIVKRIVERHGGRLWAQGQPHAGATFFFSLPSASR